MGNAAQVADLTHILVTKDTEGFFAESPQVPGLCFGRSTEAEFRRDLQPVLQGVGVQGRVQAHLQKRGVTAVGQEFLLRWAEGPELPDRLEVSRRVERLLNTSDLALDLVSTERTPMGEIVFVMAVPADTLGTFMDQLYEGGDAMVICAALADSGVFMMTLASGKQDAPGWDRLERFGWSRATAISELLVDNARGRRTRRLLV